MVKIENKTRQICKSLLEIIPGGVNSPVRALKEMGVSPVIAEQGKGALLEDVDGKRYIDFCMSWGPLILGHAHPQVIESVKRRLEKGSTFGLTTEIEEKLGRFVVERVPSVEKIRFVSSGTEATMSASRLARAFTKREVIVKFTGNYHGHSDPFLIKAGSGLIGLTECASSEGIPKEFVQHTACLPYNDIDAFVQFTKENGERIAAVILEPIAGNMGVVPANSEFIQRIFGETKKIGSLVIFDEVITGFRVGMGGAQALYGVQPDITCFGKIIGGGLPAAAFGGSYEIMEQLAPVGKVYQAGTLSGNPLAMEAGYQTLKILGEKGVYEDLERRMQQFTLPIIHKIHEKKLNACLQRVGSMFTLFFGRKKVENMEQAETLDLARFAHFFRYLLDRGIYLPPSQFESCFLSTAHTEEQIAYVQSTILAYLEQMGS